jgi:sodium/potassium-transporting ATPase subunit alpha
VLSEHKTLPWPIKLLLEFTGLFNYMLWIGAILCFAAFGMQTDKSDKSNMYLGFIVVGVVMVTGCLAFYQSSKTAAIMASFKNFIPPRAMVWRNGKKKEVNAKELVPGDIVEVNLGDNIPADLIIVKSNEMKVNNASLTGESEEMLRVPEENSRNIFESANVGFFGTACTNGSGTGIVFKTGDNTVIGQIASLAQTADAGETLISQEIGRFVKMIAAIAFTMCVIFFIVNICYGTDVISNIIYCMGILVANIPEGLQITVTVSMALAAKRMAVRKVLVKNLQSVETLGCTSCICSDKTGTLTQNKMTVSHLFYGNKLVDATLNYEDYKKDPSKSLDYDINNQDF